jgi:hypothetical protein
MVVSGKSFVVETRASGRKVHVCICTHCWSWSWACWELITTWGSWVPLQGGLYHGLHWSPPMCLLHNNTQLCSLHLQSSAAERNVSWTCLWKWTWSSCGMGCSYCFHYIICSLSSLRSSLVPARMRTNNNHGLWCRTRDITGERPHLQLLQKARSWLLQLHLAQNTWE